MTTVAVARISSTASLASRDLPIPGGPTTASRRAACSRAVTASASRICSTSRSRPTKAVVGGRASSGAAVASSSNRQASPPSGSARTPVAISPRARSPISTSDGPARAASPAASPIGPPVANVSRWAPAATNTSPATEPMPPRTTERRRKLVGVLAASVSEELDPESLHAVLDRCAEVIEQHGGTVESVSGDSVVGVFGLERLHEDDALRAARAAAELRDAGEPLRLGIEAGEVFVAAGAHRETFATGGPIGDAAGLAARAGPSEVLIGERARGLMATGVRAEPLGGDAWRFDELATAAPLEARPPTTAFVGREREVEQLRDALAVTAREHAARRLAVVGPPGIGKSRLANEAVEEMRATATVVTGRCVSYGEGKAYRPLAEIVGQLGDLDRLLAGDEQAQLIERRILGAIGRSDEPAQPEETFWAVRRLFEAAARERPLVVVIDDVHWAEPALLDLLDYVAAFSSGAPILLVCLGRPEMLERRPAWAAPQRGASVLGLDALGEVDALALVAELGAQGLAARRMVDRAEGNPLFLEQLVAIGAEGELPPTVEAVLAARLDLLDVTERALLEHAAVEGRSFHRGALAALMGGDALTAPLTALARHQLIHPERPEHAGEDGFRFAHALIREVAYHGMAKRRRAELHEKLAEWLQAKPDPEDELLGFHLERAWRYRRELGLPADDALAEEAAQRLGSAARGALRRGDAAGAAGLLERAAALRPRDEALLLPLGVALLEAGRLEDAGRVLDEAIERASDPRAEARARVERELVRLHAEPGAGTAQPRLAVEDALRLLDDDAGRCRAWRLRAWIEWTETQYGSAGEAWQRAAEHAARAGDEREQLEILGWRASAAAFGPMPVEQAIPACEEIVERVRDSPVAVAVALRPLALLRAYNGDVAEARRLTAEANAIVGELGRLHSMISHHEAQVEMAAGEPAAAAERLRGDMERLESLGEQAMRATTAAMLAQARAAQGRVRRGRGAQRDERARRRRRRTS